MQAIKYEFKTMYFQPSSPHEASKFLEEFQEIGWEFICADDGYFYFRRPAE